MSKTVEPRIPKDPEAASVLPRLPYLERDWRVMSQKQRFIVLQSMIIHADACNCKSIQRDEQIASMRKFAVSPIPSFDKVSRTLLLGQPAPRTPHRAGASHRKTSAQSTASNTGGATASATTPSSVTFRNRRGVDKRRGVAPLMPSLQVAQSK